MADDLEDVLKGFVAESEGVLKTALGSLWKDAQGAGDLYKEILSDMASQAQKAIRATDPAQKQLHLDAIQACINTSASLALQRGLKYADGLEEVGKTILQAGLKIAKGYLLGAIGL